MSKAAFTCVRYFPKLLVSLLKLDGSWSRHIRCLNGSRAHRYASYPLKTPHTSFVPSPSKSSPNKFLEIVPDLKGWKVPLLQQTRKDEVIMCRSRLGHARLTHSYLFRNEDPPECIYCACRLTVKHILIECPDFELSRQKYFNCNTLPELFEKTPEASLMDGWVTAKSETEHSGKSLTCNKAYWGNSVFELWKMDWGSKTVS